MQQWYMAIGRDQQRQTDDTQRAALLLALAALGQCVTLVEGVDEGEEIGGVEQDLLQVNRKHTHHLADDIALDGGNGRAGDPVHVVPEALARELAGLDTDQAP